MTIFGTAPGTASKGFVIPGMSMPAIISIPGFPNTSVAITSIGFSQDANVQFMHSLRRIIYIYSFGERMGTVEINGVAFYRPCDGETGLKALFNFYKNNSVSIRSTPVSFSVAGEGLSGFVRGIRSTFSDSQAGVIGYSIVMASMPEMWGT
jgi:hypothetical protein